MVRHLMRGSTDTYAVTPEDDARIRQLAQEKFAAWDAIYGDVYKRQAWCALSRTKKSSCF